MNAMTHSGRARRALRRAALAVAILMVYASLSGCALMDLAGGLGGGCKKKPKEPPPQPALPAVSPPASPPAVPPGADGLGGGGDGRIVDVFDNAGQVGPGGGGGGPVDPPPSPLPSVSASPSPLVLQPTDPPTQTASPGADAPSTVPAEQRAKIDAEIKKRGLNEYGDPIGTGYPGGTPLFDESTGKRTDKYEYILKNHPELRPR